MTASHRWEERRRLRRLERRRRRGGEQRGPVMVQRTARGVSGTWDRTRERLRRAVRGDRPLLVATLGVIALAVVIVSSPMQSYLDGRDRVDTLQGKADALDVANAELEQRVADLEEDTTVELLAREQLGLVRPGEVAYTLTPPEVDRPQITRARDATSDPAPPWYRRLWDDALERFGG